MLDCDPGRRRIFKIWEERRVPDVVFEVTSHSSRRIDTVKKPVIYEQMGVKEYYLYDPTCDYLEPALQGFRMTDGCLKQIAEVNGVLRCETLCHGNARWTLNCGIVESILFATILILVTFTQQPDYDELVKALSSSKSSAVAARDELLKCGIDAFPHLIKYIDDKTIVAIPHYEVRVSRPENILMTEMTLGTFVYYFIRRQIEGPIRPRSSWNSFLLTKENLERWLKNHKGLTIEQLRFAAISESIHLLSSEMSKNGVDQKLVSRMVVLSSRLETLVLEEKEILK